AEWLERDALYDVLCGEHRASHFELWAGDRDLFAADAERSPGVRQRRDALANRFAAAIHRYAFAQWIVHRQHDETRAELSRVGFKFFGDLQIGVSETDAWALQSLFL